MVQTNNSAGKSIVNSYIRFESTIQTAGSESGAIKFYTPNAGATAAERMIITSGGDIGFGTNSDNVTNGAIFIKNPNATNTVIKAGHKNRF